MEAERDVFVKLLACRCNTKRVLLWLMGFWLCHYRNNVHSVCWRTEYWRVTWPSERGRGRDGVSCILNCFMIFNSSSNIIRWWNWREWLGTSTWHVWGKSTCEILVAKREGKRSVRRRKWKWEILKWIFKKY